MNQCIRRTAGAAFPALVVLGLSLWVPSTPAQDEPIVLIHVDLNAWNEGYPNSNLAACWESPTVQQWRSTSLQQLMGLAQARSGVDMQAVVDHLTGEAVLAVTLTPPPAEGLPPLPQLSLAIHQPGQIDSLLELITGNLSTDEQVMLQQAILRQGDVVAFGNSPTLSAQLASALSTGGEGLGVTIPPGSFLAGQLDLGRLLEMGRAQMPPEAQGGLQDLGIGNLSSVRFSAGFRGQGLATECVADFDGPRTGLMGFIGPDRSFGLLGFLPPSATQAVALSISPPVEIYDWIATMVKTHGGPTAVQEFERGEQSFQQTTGLAPRQVWSAFGQEHALVVGGMAGMFLDMALISEVRDRATIEQLINNLIQSANETLTAQGTMTISPVPMTVGDVTYTTAMYPGLPFQLCYAFIGDHLVFATSQGQMSAICQAVTSGQTLAGAPAYASVAGEMRSEVAMLSFQDNRKTAQTLSQALMPIMALAGAQLPPEAFQLVAQLPALAEHMGSKGATLSATSTRLSYQAYHSSGAELVLAAMVLTTAAQAGLQMQAQQIETVTSTGQPGTVLVSPEPLVAGHQVSIRYDPAGGPLADAAAVNIHLGYDNWLLETIADLQMSRDPVSGHWTVILTVPTDRSQLDFVFTDGVEGWDNNDGQDWHYQISPPSEGVTL